MPFTSRYIDRLSLGDVLTLQIPTILPNGATRFIGWTEEVPASESLFEAVPSLEDIRLLLADQPKQFLQGMRSVHIRVHSKFFLFEGLGVNVDGH